MKKTKWKLPSDQWRNDTHGGAQAGRQQSNEDLREALDLLNMLHISSPVKFELITNFIARFKEAKKLKQPVVSGNGTLQKSKIKKKRGVALPYPKADKCICKTVLQAENCERNCGYMGQ